MQAHGGQQQGLQSIREPNSHPRRRCAARPPTRRSGTPRHGTERRTRRFMARPGTENHGTENLGTARHGKYWHGKIMARHGPKKYHKIDFLGKIILGRKIRDFLPGSKIPLLAIHKIISHIWEDRSRKVNNDEPDLRFFHGNF